MSVTYLDTAVIPNVGNAFKLGTAAIMSSIRIIGIDLRDGIRKYVPKDTWLMHRMCKILASRGTPVKAYVKVGWKRGDFPRGKFYPLFVGEGTGIYGPANSLIHAREKSKSTLIRYQYGNGWVSLKAVYGSLLHKNPAEKYQYIRVEILILSHCYGHRRIISLR